MPKFKVTFRRTEVLETALIVDAPNRQAASMAAKAEYKDRSERISLGDMGISAPAWEVVDQLGAGINRALRIERVQ